MMLDVISLVAVAALFGSMLFFSAVVAPYTFKSLEIDAAGQYIRGFFPWYYRVIGSLSLIAGLCLALARPLDATVMFAVAAMTLLAAGWLMPRINLYRDQARAGDRDANTRFGRLHLASVTINAAQLIAVFGVLSHLAVD
ncbi:MAG: DUF4149 domain-containing protein [Pseudomonadota bacterium]